MNQTRSFLLILWLFVAGLLWMQWNKAPTNPSGSTPETAAATAALPSDALPDTGNNAAALPGSVVTTAPTATVAPEKLITIENDVLRLTIDLHGGHIVDSQLLTYTVEKQAGSPNVHLLATDAAHYFRADAGLIRVDGQQQKTIDQQFQIESGGDQNSFVIAPGAATLALPLLATDPTTGLSVRRTLTLTRGSFVLGLSEQISNTGTTSQSVYPFVSLDRVAPPVPPKHSFMTNPETFSVVGAAWYSPEKKYDRTRFTKFDGTKPPTEEIANGWIAMLQHHFVTSWVPSPKENQKFYTATLNHAGVPLYEIKSVATPLSIAPGASATHEASLWVGPKLQASMVKLAPSLENSVDYGMFRVISQPLFDYILEPLHDHVTGNWGWAIILTVLLLKLALYPLSAKQYKSMAKMRAVMPRIEALKERYGDDRQAFAVAQMDLYKKEGVNPIGGCLPMLIPIPIFLGLYWVLIETVEIRHAPWMGWIQNLTSADPYFILPALNLAVMFLTQKLTPTPGMDPMQKKMMQFMPLVFGGMMAFFPSGLVLYWVTNGALGLLQQWWMTKQHGPKTAATAVR